MTIKQWIGAALVMSPFIALLVTLIINYPVKVLCYAGGFLLYTAFFVVGTHLMDID